MRYRKKEIGCEVRYSELDLRAMEYIEEFAEDGREDISICAENYYKDEDEPCKRFVGMACYAEKAE